MNDSSLNYTGNEIIVPENNLRNLEERTKAAFQLGVVKGKNSFLLSYSNNNKAFYKLLPTVNELMKSIVILR